MTTTLLARMNVAHIHTVQTAGNRFGHCTLFKGGVVAQLVDLTLVYAAILCKAAVDRCSVADHICAVVCNAVPAEIALAAIAVRVDADTVAYLYIGYRSTNFSNYTGKFVSQNGRRCHFCCTLVALINVHICAADTACLYLNQNIFCSDLRHRGFFDSHVMFTIKNCTFHLKYLRQISFD